MDEKEFVVAPERELTKKEKEELQRKSLSRSRIFWAVVVVDILLAALVVVEVISMFF